MMLEACWQSGDATVRIAPQQKLVDLVQMQQLRKIEGFNYVVPIRRSEDSPPRDLVRWVWWNDDPETLGWQPMTQAFPPLLRVRSHPVR